ncbi:MAG: DegV family protein [Clostridiales bacterium]|jgi:DegV family protein with EDD domain|nr:DegV family protein [Clostridiales bacterium]
MQEYVIITDSTTDLSPEMVRQLELEIIPLQFVMEGHTYLNYPDGRELSEKNFYEMLRNQKVATTVQVNASRFLERFEPILQQGKDILYIAFSSGLSGTYGSAIMAREELKEKYPDRQVLVSDSLSASMGEGLLVYHAVMEKRKGKSIQEVFEWVEQNKRNLCHWFTVDDLNHLKRGGRVSSATALLGTMLGIKPVLHVDDEGHLINVSKVRGRRQSLQAMVDKMKQTCVNAEEQVVFISHGDCIEDAQALAEMVRSAMKVKEIVIHYIGPVIGAHSGPGTVALFFLGDHR